MILNIDRGSMKLSFNDKTVTVPGEMFFPPNGKMGFVIFSHELKHWDYPYQDILLDDQEKSKIIDFIRLDFERGGNLLEVE